LWQLLTVLFYHVVYCTIACTISLIWLYENRVRFWSPAAIATGQSWWSWYSVRNRDEVHLWLCRNHWAVAIYVAALGYMWPLHAHKPSYPTLSWLYSAVWRSLSVHGPHGGMTTAWTSINKNVKRPAELLSQSKPRRQKARFVCLSSPSHPVAAFALRAVLRLKLPLQNARLRAYSPPYDVIECQSVSEMTTSTWVMTTYCCSATLSAD